MGNKIQRIYIGNTRIRPKYGNYSPTSKTLAYYPLISNTDDVMEKTTIGGTKSQATLGYTFTAQGGVSLVSGSYVQNSIMVGFWCKVNSTSGEISACYVNLGACRFQWYHVTTTWRKAFVYRDTGSGWYSSAQQSINTGQWFHCLMQGNSSGNLKCYINGNKIVDTTLSLRDLGATVTSYCTMAAGGGNSRNITFSELIIEKEPRTDQQVVDYYNNTKANYGL